MIIFNNVSKSFEKDEVSVHDINLEITKGEFVTLIGHSGAGKTTLIRLLLAETKPTEGTITFNNTNIHNLRRSSIPQYRQRIGVVFQDYKLLEHKTVFENIAFAMEMIGKSSSEIYRDVPNALELVGLQSKAQQFPTTLSGGEQQRLAIARAIINQPDVLIADEPTGSLDPESSANVMQILEKINELGTTVILATHDKAMVDGHKKRVISIDHGRIVRDDNEGGYHHTRKKSSNHKDSKPDHKNNKDHKEDHITHVKI